MNDATTYDDLLDAGREPATPCPVCTGDSDAPPCGEDCDRIMTRTENRRRARRLRSSVRIAVSLIRLYRTEHVPNDVRVAGCIGQIIRWRREIRELRAT